ncbi:MAG: endonuclease V [Syntrophobacteraceae bacterium]|jgi:deoxyribonuclease V|nr:endonuclease V [Syntrophobacteraceae bacterium]
MIPCEDIWKLTPAEARELQSELVGRVVIRPLPGSFEILGAADIGYVKASNLLAAAVVTFAWPELEPMEEAHAVAPARFPYVPGLLSFREIPALLEAFARLNRQPRVLLCDGQGIAHPRRFGLASHLGLCLGIPTVGCAKKRLCGDFEPFGRRRGQWSPLTLDGDAVGRVLCTRDGVKPVYVSPGHLADIPSSAALILKCLRKFRIPEPLRRAHLAATRLRSTIA